MAEGHPKPCVLVVDDEPQIRRLLKSYLEANGYRVYAEASGQSGLTVIIKHRPDVVVLDLGLPDMRGLDLVRRLREWSNIPIMILSARGGEEDKVAAFASGVDDYIIKPFGMGEFLARLRVALRHADHSTDAAVFRSGLLEVDLASREVWVAGRRVKLTTTEYALLRYFVRNHGKLLTHAEIMNEIWGPAHADQLQYLRVYIRRLRKIIEPEPATPAILLTELGTGYRLIIVPQRFTGGERLVSLTPNSPITNGNGGH